MRRDYKEIIDRYLDHFNPDNDFIEAITKDLIADKPDKHLEDLIMFIINDARDISDGNIIYGVNDVLIHHFNSLSNDDIVKFCTEYAEYEHWALAFSCHIDPDDGEWDIRKIEAFSAAESLLLIFAYYHHFAYPSEWFNSNTQSFIEPTEQVSPSLTPNPNDSSFDSFIIYDDKPSFKEAMTKLVSGKKGKNAAIYIYAAVSGGYMSKPSFTTLQNIFGIGGTKQGFNSAYQLFVLYPNSYINDISIASNALQKVLNNQE